MLDQIYSEIEKIADSLLFGDEDYYKLTDKQKAQIKRLIASYALAALHDKRIADEAKEVVGE